MNRSKLTPLAIFAVLAMVLGGSALAWACTPQASITISPNSGPPGSGATVNGSAFQSGPVEIRWNSATGTKLTDATGPNFSVGITIPQTSDDVYYVVAVAVGTSYRASTPFEVISPSSSENEPEEESSGSGSSSGSTSGSEGSSGSGGGSTSGSASGGDGSSGSSGGTESSGSKTSSGSGGTSSGSTSGSSSGSTSGSSNETSSGNTSSGGTSGRGFEGPVAGPTATGVPASSNPLKVRTASGAVVFGGSLGPASTEGDRAGGERADATPGPAEPSSSDSTAFGDLWGGFASDSSGSLIPGLGDPVQHVATESSQLMFGIALLGAGLVALSAGFLVAAARRRRAAVQVDPR